MAISPVRMLSVTVGLLLLINLSNSRQLSDGSLRRVKRDEDSFLGDFFARLFGGDIEEEDVVPNVTSSAAAANESATTSAENEVRQNETIWKIPPITSSGVLNESINGTEQKETSWSTQLVTGSGWTTSQATKIWDLSTSPGTTNETPDCQNESVDLHKLCGEAISLDINEYFDWNITSANVASVLFLSYFLEDLQTQCPPGEWCLPPAYFTIFSEVNDEFYNSPICYESFFNCMEMAVEERHLCADFKKVSILLSSIVLVCRMNEFEDVTNTCLNRVLALLHVTMADATRDVSSTNATDVCSSREGKMLKQFECLTETCPEVRQLLLEFGPWQWFLKDKSVLNIECNFTDVCSNFVPYFPLPSAESTRVTDVAIPVTSSAPEEREPEGFFDEDYPEPEVTPSTTTDNGLLEDTHSDKVDNAETGGDENIFSGYLDNESHLMIGISVGILFALVGLTVLILSCWKRARFAKSVGKKGYTRLPTHLVE